MNDTKQEKVSSDKPPSVTTKGVINIDDEPNLEKKPVDNEKS